MRVEHPWGIELISDPVAGVVLTAEVRPKGHVRFNIRGKPEGLSAMSLIAVNNTSMALLAEAKQAAKLLRKRK
jgi:hypothetical protein